MTTKQISFNLFEMNCVGHISHGLWAHPDNTRHRFNDIDFWTEDAVLFGGGAVLYWVGKLRGTKSNTTVVG
jgi:hypothetical protein